MLFKTVIISMLAAVALAAPVATRPENKIRQDLGSLLGGVTGATNGNSGAKGAAGAGDDAAAGRGAGAKKHDDGTQGIADGTAASAAALSSVTGLVGGLLGGLRRKM